MSNLKVFYDKKKKAYTANLRLNWEYELPSLSHYKKTRFFIISTNKENCAYGALKDFASVFEKALQPFANNNTEKKFFDFVRRNFDVIGGTKPGLTLEGVSDSCYLIPSLNTLKAKPPLIFNKQNYIKNFIQSLTNEQVLFFEYKDRNARHSLRVGVVSRFEPEYFILAIGKEFRTFYYDKVIKAQMTTFYPYSSAHEFSFYELELALTPEAYLSSLEVVLTPVKKIETHLEPEGKTLIEDYLEKKKNLINI